MKNFWKFLIGFLAIMVLVGGGYFVWDRYFSPQTKANRETQKNYEKYLTWQANYEKAMREDTFGGKTPEETLQLFIEALKKEDIELASKYFMLETNTQDPNYLTRKKWEDGLKKAKEEKKLELIYGDLEKAKITERSSDLETVWFGVFNEKGEVLHEILLKLNKISGVWKIESL